MASNDSIPHREPQTGDVEVGMLDSRLTEVEKRIPFLQQTLVDAAMLILKQNRGGVTPSAVANKINDVIILITAIRSNFASARELVQKRRQGKQPPFGAGLIERFNKISQQTLHIELLLKEYLGDNDSGAESS